MVFGYGVAVGRYELFPFQTIERIHSEVRLAVVEEDPWFVRPASRERRDPVLNKPGAYDGLNLVTRFVDATVFQADIIDMDGKLLHSWDTDWFELWPDADHVPAHRLPQRPPGTHIHGAVVLAGGDLVFNFEHLGLMRLDPTGKVVWRLPYATHHSVHLAASGNLWVSGQVDHEQAVDRFPQRQPPFSEYTALEVSPDGEILNEWSIAQILDENGLHGLLHLGTTANQDMRVGGADLLHLNDVEPFPDSMQEGVFRQGDVLVSLRNVNTVLVFNRDTRRIRYITTGTHVRQHDADFLDGNRFSVYDNNNTGPEDNGQQSRIVIVDAAEGRSSVYFEGSPRIPFYSDIMGKHQWLPNGNLLITESMKGRAFEIDGSGELVWEYVNYVGPETVGLVEEVQRIPSEFESLYMSDAGFGGN